MNVSTQEVLLVVGKQAVELAATRARLEAAERERDEFARQVEMARAANLSLVDRIRAIEAPPAACGGPCGHQAAVADAIEAAMAD